jgi:hypothetical protein
MPKDLEQSNNLVSCKAKRSRYHPYNEQHLISEEISLKDGEINAQKKEWDNTVCLICMEHPHNAVLLLCSSSDKGCCPYMCDTSYRHSNCLDRYRKPQANFPNHSSQSIEVYIDDAGGGLRSLANLDGYPGIGGPGNTREVLTESWTSRSEGSEDSQNRRASHVLSELQSGRIRDGLVRDEGETSVSVNSGHLGNETEGHLNDEVELKCPLCRGTVKGYKVIEAARQYLNMKMRNCSHESCSFSGTYEDLRKHARSVHPTARPADVDPSRQRAWRHLERQRDFGDVLSTIRSAMPSAIVLGDYVIDSEDGIHFDRGDENENFTASRSWLTTLFLFQMITPIASDADARGFPARWRAARRQHISPGMLSVQHMLGDHIVDTDSEESDNVSTNEANNGASELRRRRRSNRFRHGGELP